MPDDRQLDIEIETGTGAMRLDLPRRLVAEALGTGFLIIAVIGSGIMATRLSPNDVGLQLLENAAATGGALIGLILMLGAVSGAHFNPVVTPRRPAVRHAVDPRQSVLCVRPDRRRMPRRDRRQRDVRTSRRRMVDQDPLFRCAVAVRSRRHRRPPARHPRMCAFRSCGCGAVRRGVWICGAYFFTSSTSFANPAVTIARTMSDSFAGIKPSSAPMFIVMQLIGAAIAFVLIRFLYPHHGDR